MNVQNYPTHQQYQQNVKHSITTLYAEGKIKSITHYTELIGKMFLSDLTDVRELMTPHYSSKPRGSLPRDPAAMLRSLLLMKQTGEHSITTWVQSLKNSDVYATLSGFEPDNVSGIGTFYDFISRLAGIDKQAENQRRKKPMNFKRKPSKKLKQNQKLPPKHPDIVNKMVDRVIKYENQPLHLGQHQLILDIFSQCFVQPSATKKLLGDTQKMIISGDGTLINTAASPYGKKICDCQSKGIYRVIASESFPITMPAGDGIAIGKSTSMVIISLKLWRAIAIMIFLFCSSKPRRNGMMASPVWWRLIKSLSFIPISSSVAFWAIQPWIIMAFIG